MTSLTKLTLEFVHYKKLLLFYDRLQWYQMTLAAMQFPFISSTIEIFLSFKLIQSIKGGETCISFIYPASADSAVNTIGFVKKFQIFLHFKTRTMVWSGKKTDS